MIIIILYNIAKLVFFTIQKIYYLLLFFIDNMLINNIFFLLSNFFLILFFLYQKYIYVKYVNNIKNKKNFNSLLTSKHKIGDQYYLLNNKNITKVTNEDLKVSKQKNNREIIKTNQIITQQSKKMTNRIKNNKPNKKDFITKTKLKNILYLVPKNMHIINYKLPQISQETINFIIKDNYKLNDNKMSALNAYFFAKQLFRDFFKNELTDKCFQLNFNFFIEIYAQNIESSLLNVPKYNFYIKMHNKYKVLPDKHAYNIYENVEYLCINSSTLIKIKNTKSILYIEKLLDSDNLFIALKENKIILSYGACIDIDINNEQIEKFFKNSMTELQIKKYYRYNKIKMICWVSVFT